MNHIHVLMNYSNKLHPGFSKQYFSVVYMENILAAHMDLTVSKTSADFPQNMDG